MNNKYLSRKFIVTMTVAIIALILALLELLTNPVALVLIACVGAYNYANAKTHQVHNVNE